MANEKKPPSLRLLPCSHQDGKARVRIKAPFKTSLLLIRDS